MSASREKAFGHYCIDQGTRSFLDQQDQRWKNKRKLAVKDWRPEALVLQGPGADSISLLLDSHLAPRDVEPDFVNWCCLPTACQQSVYATLDRMADGDVVRVAQHLRGSR